MRSIFDKTLFRPYGAYEEGGAYRAGLRPALGYVRPTAFVVGPVMSVMYKTWFCPAGGLRSFLLAQGRLSCINPGICPVGGLRSLLLALCRKAHVKPGFSPVGAEYHNAGQRPVLYALAILHSPAGIQNPMRISLRAFTALSEKKSPGAKIRN